jgi:Peptidase family M23
MSARIGDKYGMRDDPRNPGTQRMHYGQDFPAATGTPITSNRPLQVVANDYQMKGNVGWGNYVELKDPQTGMRYRMAHLDSKPDWKPGETIPAGSVVGHVGNTGGSGGSHLHYETITSNGKPDDPAKYKDTTPLTWDPSGKGTLWNTLDKANKDPNYKKGSQPPSSSSGKSNDPIGDAVKRKEEADRKKAQKDKEATQQNNKRMTPEGTNKPRRGNKGTGLTSGSPWHNIGDGG